MDEAKELQLSGVIRKPVKQKELLNALAEAFGLVSKHSKTGTEESQEQRIPEIQRRILLVDDTQDNLKLGNLILQKAGYLVDTADNGLLALNAIQKFHYDLVLMDIQMPVMDGFKATQAIRVFEKENKRERVGIIALTAHAMTGYREKCLEHDMDDYITKPLRKKILLDVVAKWIPSNLPILLVDDSPENRKLIQVFLKNKPEFKLVIAENGQQGVDLFKQRSFSMILMDMEMPIMDGYTATAEIRQFEHGKTIPVLALTAHQGKREIDKCLQAGCTGYVSKPIKKQKLIDVIESYLKGANGIHVVTEQEITAV